MTALTATLGGETVAIHFDAATLPIGEMLGLDVESTWMTKQQHQDPDFRVRLVQFGSTSEAWVLDVLDDMQQELARVQLDNRNNSFCSHTNMDVMSVWTRLGVDIADRNVDTRMLATMADPDRNEDRDLKTLATAYGMPELAAADEELYAWMKDRWIAAGGKKGAAKSAIEADGWNALAVMPELPEVYLRYAGLDAIACRRLADILTPATHNPPELLRTDQWLHVKANHLQMAGKRIDLPVLDTMLTEARQVTSAAKSKAMDLTDGVNIDGPKIHDWFADHGVDWSTWEGARTKDTGNPSLAKENIKLVGNYPLDDVAREVLAEMQLYKSQLDILRKAEDIEARRVGDRIFPALNPIGASTTARMSASGPNMQNFSKRDPRLRGLFLPDDGFDFWTIDFAQIELRILAGLAREQKMIDVILAGGDLHDLTVALLLERSIEITRDIAKMTNFLTVYGGGGKALHEQANIPLDVAYDVVRTQNDAYPSIQAYKQWLGMEKDSIRTVSHRRLPVTRNKKTGDIRAYANLNYMVQSSAREALVYAWQRLESIIPNLVWFPVHDELVLQVPHGQGERVKQVAEWAMTFDFRGVPIEAEAIELRDEDGVSRWMDGKRAERIAKDRLVAA